MPRSPTPKKDKKHKKQKRRSPSGDYQRDRKKEKKEKKDKNREKQRSRSRSYHKSTPAFDDKVRRDGRRDERIAEDRRPDERQRPQERREEKREERRSDRKQPEREQKRRSPSPAKALTDEEERARKLAMRKVRARLLKFNELLKSSDDEKSEEEKEEVKKPPQPEPAAAKPADKKPKKRVSKWGKDTASEPVPIAAASEPVKAPQPVKEEDSKLLLEPDRSEDHLRLSEDKSVEIEMEEEVVQVPQETGQQVDPLDEFMMEVEQEAAPQMELAMRPKANVISFQDVVTSTSSWDIGTPRTQEAVMEGEDEEVAEDQRSKFLDAISKLNQTKKLQKTDDRGTLMELNEEKKEAMEELEQEELPELDYFAKQKKMARRKQLTVVDHSQMQYEQVKFNIYREAEQVKNLDPSMVKKYRKEAGDIKVRGKDLPNPVFNWYQCGYSDKVLALIEKRQYEKPFPIQAQSMPLLLSGRDVIGISETGSGKTLAYLLPLIKHVQEQRRVEEGEGPVGLIMTPTRQLARQVYLQAKAFCKPIGLRVIAVYGGQSVQTQLSDFKQGAEIVVCTPGRMIDVLTLNRGRVTNLRRVTYLVIDEADRMFDLGFQPQINRIIDNIRPVRQSCLYTVTFPMNVQGMARRILKKPVEIIVGSRGQACHNVTQVVQVREESSKFLRLLELLGIWHEKGSVLIFVDKQTEASLLFQQLNRYGYHALLMYGAMDSDDRQFAIYDFKKGVKTIMIATSVCARGLDIPAICLVVNFKCPNHLEDYIHRIGRTGRGGNRGTAITFITPQEQMYAPDLIKALQMAEVEPPETLTNLSQAFLRKVKRGEASKMRNRNLMGSGFKFDEDEEERNSQIKDVIKTQMKNEGLNFSDSDEEDLEVRKKKQEDMRSRNHQERISEAIKNPEIKQKLLKEAVEKVSEAFLRGEAMTSEEILEVAKKAMTDSVGKYKAAGASGGVAQVEDLIEQFANQKGVDGPNFFSYDFEINDYPMQARNKVTNRGFLNGIQQSTNCTVSELGVQVDVGKKAPLGHRKKYLHIKGENKHYVSEAFKQIKQAVEEEAYTHLHAPTAPGKYTI